MSGWSLGGIKLLYFFKIVSFQVIIVNNFEAFWMLFILLPD